MGWMGLKEGCMIEAIIAWLALTVVNLVLGIIFGHDLAPKYFICAMRLNEVLAILYSSLIYFLSRK